MFETLLQLPLFQGFSVEQLTQLIETVGMDFQKYQAGDTILKRGDDCAYARFLLSGSVRLNSLFFEDSMTIHETITAPQIILPNYLYGWATASPSDVTAIDEVGILQFSKSVFEQILSSYPVFLINYLNILSYRAQYTAITMASIPGTLEERLFERLSLILQRGSTQVVVETPRANLADALGAPRLAIYTLLDELHNSGKIKLGRGRFEIL